MSIKPHKRLLDLYYKLISIDKIRFLIVGAIGFIVNFAMLALFYGRLGLPIIPAQLIAVETAVLATFIGNNFWAFAGKHRSSIWKKLIKFHLSALGGIIINSIIVVVLTETFDVYYGLSLVFGSIAGLVWNYTLYKKFVFKFLVQEQD